jgi:hypothetical protein
MTHTKEGERPKLTAGWGYCYLQHGSEQAEQPTLPHPSGIQLGNDERDTTRVRIATERAMTTPV